MWLNQLNLVLWKNLLIRKRHWFLTFIEVILPLLSFMIIAYGRSKITGLNKIEHPNPTIHEVIGINEYLFDAGNIFLGYIPEDNFTADIIRRVQLKYDIHNNNIRGFSSPAQLNTYLAKDRRDTKVVVEFRDVESSNFNYAIRFYGNNHFWKTDKLFPGALEVEYGSGSEEYFRSGFLSIQHAVDTSYIEALSGKRLSLDITFQEFPYPPYTSDSGLQNMFNYVLPLITIFSFIFICPAVMKRVVEEKETGIKELMKMVGMKSWMLWFGWFVHGMIPITISLICIIILLKVPLWGVSYAPIDYTDGTILFLFLLLYCMSSIVFCFLISTWCSRPSLATVCGIVIWIMTYFVPKSIYDAYSTSAAWSVKFSLGLFPNMALHYGFQIISSYEEREVGLQWNTMYTSASGASNEISMFHVFLMFFLQMIIYMVFTLYIESINPGPYGIRKSIFFPISFLRKFIANRINNEEFKTPPENCPFDLIERGDGMEPGIEIQSLYKKYDNFVAVDGLTLDIYKNQITVLLGQNGAGKTTTMSMITGMIQSSGGSIRMYGKNIKDPDNKVMKSLGLCPQHNLLFLDLTVLEHLIFFARLRNCTYSEAQTKAIQLLKELGLYEKKDEMACNLSGGMKRKLCLGMAVIGDPKVLILDEPTSGMDPESRRELWDLLLKWRGSKTILITTHFMDEADVLGDWIAIMAHGRLQCYGTPMFLKKKYDTGYHLSLMVDTDAPVDDITNSIRKCIRGAEYKMRSGNNVIYLLPIEKKKYFPDALRVLEDESNNLHIKNMSVTVTTLEDVFLSAKLDSEGTSNYITFSDKQDVISQLSSANPGRHSFGTDFISQIRKRSWFFKHKLARYVTSLLITLVIFLLSIILAQSESSSNSDGPFLNMDLSIYGKTGVFYSGDSVNPKINNLKFAYERAALSQKGDPIDVNDVVQAIIDKGTENIIYYKHHLVVAAEIGLGSEESFTVNALYSSKALHSAPISLNLAMNAIAKFVLGEEHSISTTNSPLKALAGPTATKEVPEIEYAVLWLIVVSTGFLFLQSCFIIFPFSELSTSFTRIQYMCGLKIWKYWLINFFFDMMLYTGAVAIIIFTCTFYALISQNAIYNNKDTIVGLFAIMIVYGLCGIPWAYLFSRGKSAAGSYALLIITGIFIGIIPPVIVKVLIESGDSDFETSGRILKNIFLITLPHFGFTYNGVNFMYHIVSVHNWGVQSHGKNLAVCLSEKMNPCCLGDNLPECQSHKNYFTTSNGEHLYDLLLQLGGMVLYMVLNILIDNRAQLFNYVEYVKRKSGYSQRPKQGAECYSVLKVDSLRKSYGAKQVVKDVNFGVNKGECFGLLGVNGAGKSTTFRMLTGEEIQNDGYVTLINKDSEQLFDNTENLGDYVKNIGYCPQSDYLNFALTGQQLLETVASLRGLERPEEEADKFVQIFGLEEYANKPCGLYSGGNKRKLSIAISLIGFPKCILLDEPTNGVDPISRRSFWDVLRSVQRNRQTSFVLTSHSMQECEALCDRLSILKNGKIEEEGTIAELKEKIGAGFTITLKLKPCPKAPSLEEVSAYDEVDGASTESIPKTIDDLKARIKSELFVDPKDEHLGQLQYHVTNKIPWSQLFEKVETLKSDYTDLIEDYTISESSLENVFLNVARKDDSPKS